MAKKSKLNKLKHKSYVKSVGFLGDQVVNKVTGFPTLGLINKGVSRYDKKIAHKTAIKKSYGRMKRNPNMTSNDLSDAYYKDRRGTLTKKGLMRGGLFTQFFVKKK